MSVVGSPGATPRRRLNTADRQAGFTLTELLVVMTCFTVIAAIVLTALVSAYGSESRLAAMSNASSQITVAFMRLDGEIRYAADINQPGSSAKNYFVEFQSDWTQNTQGKSLCTQLEYNNTTGTLQQRTWLLGAAVPTGWQELASGLKPSLSTNPFSLTTAVGSPWQLTISLSSTFGSGSIAEPAQSSFTISALDTTASSISQNVCGGTPP